MSVVAISSAMPTRLEVQTRAWLRAVTLMVLTAIAAYLTWHYRAAAGPIALLLGSAYVAEAAPNSWRRRFFGEILLVVIGVITLLWTRAIDGTTEIGMLQHDLALVGWVRMILACAVLVPANFGRMRNIAALVATELLLAGEIRDGFWSYLVLVPFALVCLALDNWTRSLHNPPTNNTLIAAGRERGPAWRILHGVVVTVLIGSLLSWWAIRTVQHGETPTELSLPNAAEERGHRNLAKEMRIGDRRWIAQDPAVIARLTVDADVDRPPSTYLRALAVPIMEIRGPEIIWRSPDRALVPIPERPTLHRGHETTLGMLFREADGGKIAFRPDGASWIGLIDLYADDDGNLYQEGLGKRPTRYPVDIGAGSRPLPSFVRLDRAECLAMPDDLGTELRRRVGQLEQWRVMDPVSAAEAVGRWLGRRCGYTIRDLPRGWDVPGGSVLKFLFGQPGERRGHCQYFATSAVLLLRAAGHPARPVVGFSSDEVDERGVTFRALNAHAWIEVVDDDDRWHRVDVTPPSRFDARAAGVDFEDPAGDPDDYFDAADPTGGEAGLPDAFGAGFWFPAIGISLLLLLSSILLIGRRRNRGDPQRVYLEKQTEDLVRLAGDLGVRVDVNDTLSEIVGRIEDRSGLPLGDRLRDHLEARYGPEERIPPPWPLREIRRAYASRRAESTKTES